LFAHREQEKKEQKQTEKRYTGQQNPKARRSVGDKGWQIEGVSGVKRVKCSTKQ